MGDSGGRWLLGGYIDGYMMVMGDSLSGLI